MSTPHEFYEVQMRGLTVNDLGLAELQAQFCESDNPRRRQKASALSVNNGVLRDVNGRSILQQQAFLTSVMSVAHRSVRT
jgi:hypothetical protein